MLLGNFLLSSLFSRLQVIWQESGTAPSVAPGLFPVTGPLFTHFAHFYDHDRGALTFFPGLSLVQSRAPIYDLWKVVLREIWTRPLKQKPSRCRHKDLQDGRGRFVP